MRCDEFRAASRGFACRSATPAAAAECDAHLRACGPCAHWFAQACALTCRELTDFLAEYLDGAMDADRASVFEDHVRLCGECESYLDGYRKALALGRDACADPEPVPDRLVAAILAARARGRRPPSGT